MYESVRAVFASCAGSFVSIDVLLCGVQLLAVGAVSEHLGLIYASTVGRPAYVIRDTTSTEEALTMMERSA